MLRADVRGFSRVSGFREDAMQAMQTSPGYFAAWYTAKSWLLVGVTAALAYHLGKRSR
jgi:hypothetical protein